MKCPLSNTDLQMTERSGVKIDCDSRRALGVSRREALKRRSTTRLSLLRLVSVSIWFAAIAVLMPSHLSVSTWTSAEAECFCHEGGERSKQKQLGFFSARHRLDPRRRHDLSRPHEAGSRLQQIASYADRVPAIVGHQLANGLGAPLLIYAAFTCWAPFMWAARSSCPWRLHLRILPRARYRPLRSFRRDDFHVEAHGPTARRCLRPAEGLLHVAVGRTRVCRPPRERHHELSKRGRRHTPSQTDGIVELPVDVSTIRG